MYVKILGACLVIASTTYLGFHAAENEKRHLDELAELERTLWQMQGEIAYTKAPAADIFGRIAPRIREPFRNWVEKMGNEADQMRSSEFGTIWEKSVELCLKDTRFSKSELRELSSIGKQLGGAGSDMQEKLLKWHAKQLVRRENELMDEIKDRQKLYRCLGITAGFFLVLFFL